MLENKLFLKGVNIEKVAAVLFVLGFAMFCLVYFSSFLQPFILAIMIWYLIFELRRAGGKIRIRGKQLPQWLLTILAFIIILMMIFGVIEIITHNLELAVANSADYLANVSQMLGGIQKIEGFEEIQQRIIERILTFDFRPLLTRLINSISGIAGNIFLIIIYVSFLMAEEKLFAIKMKLLLKDATRVTYFQSIVTEIHSAVRTYAFVKTLMSLLTALLSYGILLIFGVDFPILWAFVIFLLNFVPYIGSLIATLLPAIFAVFQFQSFSMFIWVFLAIEIVQIVVGNVIEPKVMGRTLNLSPLGVLLALTFWGIIWGIVGMILSVPITSILVIIASRFPATRFIAILFSESGEFPNEKIVPSVNDPAEVP
jgi:AI-2 transport protein TqsA